MNRPPVTYGAVLLSGLAPVGGLGEDTPGGRVVGELADAVPEAPQARLQAHVSMRP